MLGKVNRKSKLSNEADRIVLFQIGLLGIIIGSFVLPDIWCLAQGQTIKGEAVIMNTDMRNDWRPNSRYMTVTLAETNSVYRCHVIDVGFTEGSLIDIEILPFSMYASVTEENKIRSYAVSTVFHLLCALLFAYLMTKTYKRYKRRKKYYLKQIHSFSLTSVKLRFGEAVGTLVSVLLLMGVSFWEAFYTVLNYCNPVCIAIILIDASVFMTEGMLMVGAIKCLHGGKKNTQDTNKELERSGEH